MHPRRRSAAVVPVGDVERADLTQRLAQRVDLRRVVDHPQRVPHTVARGQVDVGLARRRGRHHGVEGGRRPVHEEHRLVLNVECVDVPHAVELLVGARELVHAHPPGVVVVDGHDRDHAGLHDVAHDLAVDRVGGRRVADEDAARDEVVEGAASELVDLVGVRVCAGRQVDLGARDPQERVLVAAGPGAGLLGVDDVVRRRHDAGLEPGRRSQRSERADVDHVMLPSVTRTNLPTRRPRPPVTRPRRASSRGSRRPPRRSAPGCTRR